MGVSASAVCVRHRVGVGTSSAGNSTHSVAVGTVSRHTISWLRIVPTVEVDARSVTKNVEVRPDLTIQQQRMTVATSSVGVSAYGVGVATSAACVANAVRVSACAAGRSARRIDSVRVAHAVGVGRACVHMVDLPTSFT